MCFLYKSLQAGLERDKLVCSLHHPIFEYFLVPKMQVPTGRPSTKEVAEKKAHAFSRFLPKPESHNSLSLSLSLSPPFSSNKHTPTSYSHLLDKFRVRGYFWLIDGTW